MDQLPMDKLSWSLYPTANLAQWQTQWQTLHQQTGAHILLDIVCIKTALIHFPAPEAVTAVATEHGKVVAAGIFIRPGLGRWITYQPSQLPLGVWLTVMPEDLERLLNTLSNKLPGLVSTISITQQDPQLFARPATTVKLDTLDYITTGKLLLSSPFTDYWATRSKNTRQNLNKIYNRLQADQLSAELKVISDDNKFAECVLLYGQIEQKSWKNAEGTALTENDVQSRFYIDLLTALGSLEAEVWCIETPQGTVAADLCIRRGKTLIILKTTYLEEWAKYSPAFLMHVKGIEYCTEIGLESIEFYGPAMEWHRKLTEHLRVMYHVNYYHIAIIKKIKTLLKHTKKQQSVSSFHG